MNITIVKSDGTAPTGDSSGYTLEAATTYYAEILSADGREDLAGVAAHIRMASALVVTSINLQSSCFADVDLHSTAVGDWLPEDPPDAYVSASGNASADGTVGSKTAAAAGGLMYQLSGVASLRLRFAIVVGAAGGVMRIASSVRR